MKLGRKNIFGRPVDYLLEPLYGLEGAYCPVKGTITIDPKCQDKVQTILHEEFHAVWDRLGLNQTSVHADIQDIICESFATFITENYTLKQKK